MNRLTCLAGLVLLGSMTSSAQAQVIGYSTYTVAPAPCVVYSQYVTATPVVTQYHYVAPAPIIATAAVPAYGVVGHRSAVVGPLGGRAAVGRVSGPYGSVGVARGVGPFGGRGVAVFGR